MRVSRLNYCGFLLLFFSGWLRAAPAILFEHLPARFNLHQGLVTTIVQTRDGLVWFGKSNGLYCYDGRELRAYPVLLGSEHNPASSDLRSLVEDELGRLWLGGSDGVLQVFDRQADRFLDLSRQLPPELKDPVFNLGAQSLGGKIWFATPGGLLVIDGKTLAMHRLALPGDEGVGALAVAGDALLATSLSGHVYRLTMARETWTRVYTVAPENSLLSLVVRSDGQWLALMRDAGIFLINPSTGETPRKLWPRPGAEAELRLIRAMALAPDQSLWLANYARHLVRVDTLTGEIREFSHDERDPYSISGDEPYSVYIDHQQNLWVYLAGMGVDRANIGSSRFLLEQDRTTADASLDVNAVLPRRDGGFWLTGKGELLKRFDPVNGQYQGYSEVLRTALPENLRSTRAYVTGMVTSTRGDIWLGFQFGLLRYRPSDDTAQWVAFPDAMTLRSVSALRMAIDPEDVIWLGLIRGVDGIFSYDTRKQIWQKRELARSGNAGAYPHVASLAAFGTQVWIGTNNHGLMILDTRTGAVRTIAMGTGGIAGANIQDIVEDASSGHVWLGTGAGLIEMVPESGELRPRLRLGVVDGQTPTIYTVLPTGSGKFWLGTSMGLLRFDPVEGNISRYGVSDGVPATGFPPGARMSDSGGQAWMGTYLGLLRLDSEASAVTPPRPRLLLREYVLGGKVVAQAGDYWPARLDLDYANRYLRLSVIGLDLPAASLLRYRYRLLGIDDAWRANGGSGELGFSHLPAGDYRLQLEVSDRRGHFSGPIHSLEIRVSPPLWRSPWAYLLYALLALGVGGGFVVQQWQKRVALARSEGRLKAALWGSGDGFWDADLIRGSIFRDGLEFLGWKGGTIAPELAGWLSRVHPEDRELVDEAHRLLRSGEAHQLEVEYRLRNAEGEWRWILERGRVIETDAGGRHRRASGTYKDIHARRLAEDELRYLATHDPLTGLANRAQFRKRLKRALVRAQRHAGELAVLFIDLDRFKHINDSLGHQFGDRVLQAVAARLTEVTGDEHLLARLGGDEFMILATAPSAVAALAIELAEKLLFAFTEALAVDGSELVMSPSIGIALAPAHAEDRENLIRCADIAMYHAKDAGRNAYRLYDVAMDAAASRRQRLEAGLRRALERQEFQLVYQPKIGTASGGVAGAEALLRWQNPEFGAVSPAEFIPILEDTGLIEAVGTWVLQEACNQFMRWREQGLPSFTLAVNVSAHQLQRGNLPELVRSVLQASQMPPDCLELELTETMVMADAVANQRRLAQLRDLGLSLSIDDFGTGYSSFSYLTRLPVHKLKIDRAFVQDIGHQEEAAVLCNAIIAMAHTLELEVVAEGVETAEQLALLTYQRCDEIQGYFFSKPLPPAAFADFVRAFPGAGQRLAMN